ncbi:hypothetical protein RIF29_38739 [Crotalaria pallida]|uniref:Uncharacterized protein n=1 Tax=Crotalaria pallida TaxID=3830 RepID=A0AAN9E1R2_CROPI
MFSVVLCVSSWLKNVWFKSLSVECRSSIRSDSVLAELLGAEHALPSSWCRSSPRRRGLRCSPLFFSVVAIVTGAVVPLTTVTSFAGDISNDLQLK